MGKQRLAAASALLSLCLAAGLPRAASAQPGPAAPVVLSVELHVPPGLDSQGLPALIAVRKGQPLSRRAVRESIGRLWATRRFSDVVAREVDADGGVRVVFEVAPRSCIKTISVEYRRTLEEQRAHLGSNPALDPDAVKRASGLREWSEEAERCPDEAEYYHERLRQASDGVKEAYRRRGYDEADVELELYGFVGSSYQHEQPGSVALVIHVREGRPTRLAGVTVSGDPGVPLEELTRTADLDVGQVLDRVKLDEGIERIRDAFRRSHRYRARVGEPQIQRNGQTAVVTLPVDAGPRYDFRFEGNRSFSDALLRGALDYDGSEMLDPVRLERRLAAFYRYRGFPDATVTAREIDAPDGSEAALIFDVDEGRVLQVSGISTTDDSGIVSAGELREMVAEYVSAQTPQISATTSLQGDPLGLDGHLRHASTGASLPAPEDVYVEEAFARAADEATEWYRNRGYLSAQVGVVVDRDVATNRAKVRFEVEKGPKTIVLERATVGEPAGITFQDVMRLEVGDNKPLNAGAVEEDRQAILRKLNGRGYLFATVKAVTTVEDEGRKGSILYEIDPGQQVRIGAIVRKGFVRSKEAAVDANLQFREGEVLDPEQLFQSQRNLTLTGAYRQATVRVVDPDVRSDTKDVEVAVRERARYGGETGFGLSSAEGPRVLVDADAPNVWGYGLNIGAHGRLNYFGASAAALFPDKDTDPRDFQLLNGIGGRGNLSASMPVYPLLPARIRARGDVVAERLQRPAYWFTRFAAIAGLDWTAPPLPAWGRLDERRAEDWLTANVQYELEHDRVELPSKVSRVIRYDPTHLNERFEVGNYTLQNLRSSLNLRLPFPKLYPSYTADPANFDHGVSMSGTAELTRDLELWNPYFTLKTSGNVSLYLAFARRWVLALSARAGRIYHLSNGGPKNTIIPKRFFLGGYATMRGFGEDALLSEERRAALHEGVENCRALVSRAGCSREAQQILTGSVPTSDGGDVFAVGKAELRLPSGVGNFDIGLFFEAGNLWLAMPSLSGANVDSLRYVAGVGLRYATFIGPVALDLGFNLRPDRMLNEPIANLHFNIGLF